MSVVGQFLKTKLGIPEINLLRPTAQTAPAIAQAVSEASAVAGAVQSATTLPLLTAAGTVLTAIDPALITEIDGKVETAVRGGLTRLGVPAADQDATIALIEAELAELT